MWSTACACACIFIVITRQTAKASLQNQTRLEFISVVTARVLHAKIIMTNELMPTAIPKATSEANRIA